MNPIERIVGLLFSGFMCKAYAIGFAAWIAIESARTLLAPLASIGRALN